MLLTVAIALQYSVFADDLNDDSPRFERFKRLREPLLAEIRDARSVSKTERRFYADSIHQGDRQAALGHADSAYAADMNVHRLSTDIELLARSELMATHEETNQFIGRLAHTHARLEFELLRSGRATDKAYSEQVILDSPAPAAAMYSVLYVEKCREGQPWAACEPIVALDAEWAFHYASVINQRFNAGEHTISTEPVLWDRYCRRFNISANHGGSAGAAPAVRGSV